MGKLLSELRAEENRLSEQLKAVRKLIKMYVPKGVSENAHGSETEFSRKIKNINLEVDEVMFFPSNKSELNILRSKVLSSLSRYANGRKYKTRQAEGGFNVIRIL